MSSRASIMETIKPCNVTAWSYDISIQMLKDDLSKLKNNSTGSNLEQILKKETAISEKKEALEKHCRDFGITYGKYGTKDSEVKLEPTNGEVGAEPNKDEAGTMTNGETKDIAVPFAENPVPSVDVNNMEVDSSIPPIDAATDAANAAALDEITFPPVTDMLNNDPLTNGIYSPQPQQLSMAAHDLINHDFSFVNSVDAAIDDPFVTSPDNGTSTAGYFSLSPSSRAHNSSYFGDLSGDYTPALASNDAFQAENANYTADPLMAPTANLVAQDGLGVVDGIGHNDIQDFGAPAAPVNEAGSKFDEGDEEMTIDAPVIEHTGVVIPGMENQNNF